MLQLGAAEFPDLFDGPEAESTGLGLNFAPCSKNASAAQAKNTLQSRTPPNLPAIFYFLEPVTVCLSVDQKFVVATCGPLAEVIFAAIAAF